MQVWDLRSGQPIWTYNGPGMFGNALAEPGGRDFAIYVRKPAVQDPLTDLMIVHADGTVTDFPRRYAPAWGWSRRLLVGSWSRSRCWRGSSSSRGSWRSSSHPGPPRPQRLTTGRLRRALLSSRCKTRIS